MPTRTAPPAPQSKSARLQSLADGVNKSAGQTVAAIIGTGRRLIDAKVRAGHGGWEKLFDGEELKRPIRMGIRTAERLMQIAKCAEISKASDLTVFPPATTVLLELAQLPKPYLKDALALGGVPADMELSDVKHLYPGGIKPTKPPVAQREQKSRPENESRVETLDHNLNNLGHAISRIEEHVGALTPKRVEVLAHAWERIGAVLERWGHDGDDGLNTLAEVTAISA